MQDIDTLFLFRFFIRDIYEQLKENQCSSTERVYRGQKLSISEVKKLQKSIDDFISINSFFSTSTNRDEALKFIANDSDIPDGIQRVLFEIEADPDVVTTKPFANISSHSKFKHESEILFMIGSLFRIKNVCQNDNQIWIIKMELCNDDHHHLKELFTHMKKTYADSNKEITVLSFGRVLHQMGKLDLAEKFYERLLKELPANDPSCSDLYYSLGVLTMNKGDYDACVHWFRKTLEIKFRTDPTDYIYIGGICNAIGDVYRNKEDYDQALESFNKAVDLFRKAGAENQLDMAYCYNNIGLVYQEIEKYSQALDYYEKSLAIKVKHLPLTHPSISTAHNNLGLIHYSLKLYDAALDHYQQSLDIQLKSLPSQHPDIAMTYENMGHAYEDKGDWKQALTCFKHADTIYQKASLAQHPDTVKNKENIRRVSSRVK
jgi:tetratricopeptide (TPR) repeat protein